MSRKNCALARTYNTRLNKIWRSASYTRKAHWLISDVKISEFHQILETIGNGSSKNNNMTGAHYMTIGSGHFIVRCWGCSQATGRGHTEKCKTKKDKICF